jgi:hypothetical protein
MKTKTLSPKYRVTLEDFERGHILFRKEFADGQTLTEQEQYLQHLLLDAEHMHGKTGVYPTVQEVHDKWQREAEERERKRIESWQDEGRISAYDFTCYEEQLASGDTDGPFVRFMRVAADLKTSGKQLTVGDVRTEMKKRR